ncbi:hypothetical protein F5Y05DRAFT_393293 [Hypoxylon sp. FL0543]|nr:hypothetical protein F5Y05DRAFT_393293 [Hypoxylon sp. FL0543]
MPSRRALPTLSIFSRRSIAASPTSSPPSPIRSSIPITPPARLHLRNILPSSPDGMPTPPPPPRQPYAWLWQCHSCNTVYRIGCTRRCLVCSHEYCVSADPPKARRGKKRRRGSGMCASEFDYNGWAEWGAWRRKVLGLEVLGRAGEKQRERAFANRTHNCIMDCDYPSECHHERYRLHTEAVERRYLETLEEEPESPSMVASVPLSPDDELPLDETLEIAEAKEENDRQDSPTLPKSPTSPKSPLSQTSFLWDDSDENEDEKTWGEDTERKEKKRKTKCQQKIQQLTGIEFSGLEKASSPADDADGMDPEELCRFLEEDEGMMPLEIVHSNTSQRSKSRRCKREQPTHARKLTVRNLADEDDCEDWDEWSDSDSDDGSSLSSARPSSASSLDGEWVSASDQTTTFEDSDETVDKKTEEKLERELEAMVKAGTSFLQD